MSAASTTVVPVVGIVATAATLPSRHGWQSGTVVPLQHFYHSLMPVRTDGRTLRPSRHEGCSSLWSEIASVGGAKEVIESG